MYPDKEGPSQREVALSDLKMAWIESIAVGLGEEEAVDERFNNALTRAVESGATEYDLLKARFLAEPQENRQKALFDEATTDIEYRLQTLKQAAEFFSALLRIKEEFGLKDPFSDK